MSSAWSRTPRRTPRRPGRPAAKVSTRERERCDASAKSDLDTRACSFVRGAEAPRLVQRPPSERVCKITIWYAEARRGQRIINLCLSLLGLLVVLALPSAYHVLEDFHPSLLLGVLVEHVQVTPERLRRHKAI